MSPPVIITSLQNPRVKEAIRLRKRGDRDDVGMVFIEGYREVRRALDNGIRPDTLFYCPELYQGKNEPVIVERCSQRGAELLQCAPTVFEKLSYRDRPEGLIALAPQPMPSLAELALPAHPLVVVAEAVEKPGNLGSLLRSADGSGVHAVLVCDPRTDVYNPNVVRSSIGTLFSLPVVQTPTAEALAWLRAREIQILAATPRAETVYTEADMTRGTAIVVGTEQYGLSAAWMQAADVRVRIPMLGQADSLNVAAATTILLYEAARQRGFRSQRSEVRGQTSDDAG
jgi:TrmH family RNA methyltransferase